MPRKRLLAMPVDELFNHPRWIALPAAGKGMAIAILEHFWRTDCAPLAANSNTLWPLCRAHNATWHTHKAGIIALFADLAPILAKSLADRRAGRDRLRIASTNGAAATKLRATLAAFEKSTAAPIAPTELGLVPKREPSTAPRPAPPDRRPERARLVDRR